MMKARKTAVPVPVGGSPVNRPCSVRPFIEPTSLTLHLHFFPGDANNLNPDEWVWCDLKLRARR